MSNRLQEIQLVKYLEEKMKYAEVKSKENEEVGLIRQSEWYDGYAQAFMEVLEFVKKN